MISSKYKIINIFIISVVIFSIPQLKNQWLALSTTLIISLGLYLLALCFTGLEEGREDDGNNL
jgi:hypothetical protein